MELAPSAVSNSYRTTETVAKFKWLAHDDDTLAPPSRQPSENSQILEMHWDDIKSNARICILPSACVAKHGTLILPRWMHSYAQFCGVDKLEVFDPNRHVWQYAERHHEDIDLVSHLPMRWHMPHFVTDLLAALYSIEVVNPKYTSKKSKHRICYDDIGRVKCGNEKVLNVALYGEDRIARLKRTDWVPRLSALIPGRPAILNPRNLFVNHSMACFRSTITYNPHSYIRSSHDWYGPRFPLFAQNHIVRESVIRPPNENGKCVFKVVIVNREGLKQLKNYRVGRDIINIEQLVDALNNPELVSSTIVKLNTTVAYFEKLSFLEQLNVMQNVDILVATHGAALANLLFARLDTPVIEVFPFGYFPSTFERLAQAMHLRYAYVIGAPESKHFLECVEKRGVALKNSWLTSQGITKWNEAIGLWRTGKKRVLFADTWHKESLIPAKRCVRTQRITVDAVATAQLVLRYAQGICKHT